MPNFKTTQIVKMEIWALQIGILTISALWDYSRLGAFWLALILLHTFSASRKLNSSVFWTSHIAANFQ